MIESGRHNGIARENRKCPICNTNDLEDEFHFILICPIYNELRTMYIKRYYINNPSMYKFIELLRAFKLKRKIIDKFSIVCYECL